ncbi:MAG: CTAG/PCC1 family protein [Thermoplasmata archaeon]|nr:CTAG/PCC1 family protein [Thermoplasmata archaeon]
MNGERPRTHELVLRLVPEPGRPGERQRIANAIEALAVEAAADGRIEVVVDRSAATVTVMASDIGGLRAAANTVLRMLQTAEGVAEELAEGE